MATVQKALDTLMIDGFVESRSRAGTFVVECPPHLCNYGLVTHSAEQWSLLYTAVRKAAGMIQEDSDAQFSEYITSSDVALQEEVVRLNRDISSHRLGGLVILGDAAVNNITGTPALRCDIPRVRIHSVPEYPIPIPVVCLDLAGSFIPKAVEYLTSRGHRRIAHLRLVAVVNCRKEFDAALKKTGIEVRPYWVQSVYAKAIDETTRSIVSLLMRLKDDDRPDALIIHDDNLVDIAVGGLLEAGVKVPDDLEIVAHFNYPTLSASTLPMKRLGFDCHSWLKKCIEVLDMQRRGIQPPEITYIPAISEEDLPESSRKPNLRTPGIF